MRQNHRKMHHRIVGTIVYDPQRGVDRNGNPLIHSGRVVIRLPGFGLADYYAHQFFKKFGVRLTRPSWDLHVTIFANRIFCRNKKAAWGFKNGEKVVVEYSHEMFWNDEHVWLPASSPSVSEIRNHYQNHPIDLGHITIGRFHPNDIGKIPNFCNYNDLDLWDKYVFNTPV